MACPRASTCPLHTKLQASRALTVWQTLFCDSGFDRCVRYRLSVSGRTVPPDLLPDGVTFLRPPGPDGTPRA